MIRVLLYFVLLAVLAYGGMLLVQNPGHVTINWFGEVVDAPAALIIGAIALAAIIIWSVARFVFGLPSFVKVAARQRRREKGYQALSRGLIALGSGDGRSAGKAASQAKRHLKDDPLAIMLRAQAAHVNGEGYVANAAYEELAQRDDTRVLGLRGLYHEAVRRGDKEAARHFAAAAHEAAPLPWSAQAVLEHRASGGDWEQALATVEASLAARHIDKDVGERQRAVLETAIAYDKELGEPDRALMLARSAIKRAPDLAPPVVLAARLLARKGDIRKAAKLIERAWPRCQHPDIAAAYLDVRPGDSTQDRLARAQTLMGIATYDPVGRTTVARAALANKDFDAARKAMAPLIAEGKRPTVRQCLLMAELEEAQHGDDGLWREWVSRASRAPLDTAWICDGTVYDHWAPASPKTGQLDAFQWQVPAERLGPAMDAIPLPRRKPATSLPARPAAALEQALEHHEDASDDGRTESARSSADEPLPTSLPSEAAVAAGVAEPVTAAALHAPLAEAAKQRMNDEAAPSLGTPSAHIVPAAPPASASKSTGEALPAKSAATTIEAVAPPPAARPEPPSTTPKAEAASDRPASKPTPAAAPEAATPFAPSASNRPKSPINPRIGLRPETLAEGRNPQGSHTLFHRRTQPNDPVQSGNGIAQPDDGRTRGMADHLGSAALETASTRGATALAMPNPRIALPPEVLAEGRSPDSSRSLFHRRLTPEAEARVDAIARVRGANGAARRSALADKHRRPHHRPNGSGRSSVPGKPG